MSTIVELATDDFLGPKAHCGWFGWALEAESPPPGAEADTEIGFFRFESGSSFEIEGPAVVYLMEGGMDTAAERLGKGSAAHIERVERVTLEAALASELLYIRLPAFG